MLQIGLNVIDRRKKMNTQHRGSSAYLTCSFTESSWRDRLIIYFHIWPLVKLQERDELSKG